MSQANLRQQESPFTQRSCVKQDEHDGGGNIEDDRHSHETVSLDCAEVRICVDLSSNEYDVDATNPPQQPEDKISVILHPLFIFMKVFSLFPSYKKNEGSKCAYLGILVYAVLALVYDWFNVVRYMLSYQGMVFGPKLFIKVVLNVSAFQGAFAVSVFCAKSRNISRLLEMWEQIRHEHDPSASLIQKLRITLKVTWCAIILTLFLVWIIMLPGHATLKMVRLLSVPFKYNMNTTQEITLIKLFTAVRMTWIMAQWTGSIAFLVICCLRMSDDFQKLKHDMISDLERAHPKEIFSLFDLESYRQRHIKLCKLVDVLDDIISINVLAGFMASVPVICFFLYIITFYSIDTQLVLFPISLSCIFTFSYLMLIIACGTVLSSSARSPADVLYNMELRNCPIPAETSLKMHLFLGKIERGQLGISGWKLFYINKKTIKTVILMIVSYAAILLRSGNQERANDVAEGVKTAFHHLHINSTIL